MDASYRKKIIELRGEDGEKWLDSIPSLIKKYEKLWGITCGNPFALSYNFVVPAQTSTGKDVVFKISLPTNEPNLESKSLEFFTGNGVVQLLQKNDADGVMLLERVYPGESLSEKSSGEQVAIFTDVVKKMHNQAASNLVDFPTLDLWAKDFSLYRKKFSLTSGPIPQKMFEKAEEIFTQYLKEKRPQVLLHGDLHSGNILSSQRGWLAIDPKGIVGEKEFEAGIFLRNPYGEFPQEKNYTKLQRDRIAQCAELTGFDRKRIRDWAFAAAVNGMVWFLEDTNTLQKDFFVDAEILDAIHF